MLNRYSDFVKANTRYQSLSENTDFQEIFEFLSEKDIIVKMLEATKWGKPALSGCVKELEAKFPFVLDWDDKEYFLRQAIGYMVKVVLEPFGYVPNIQKRISPPLNKVFSSATVYKFDQEKARLKLIQKWEIVEV